MQQSSAERNGNGHRGANRADEQLVCVLGPFSLAGVAAECEDRERQGKGQNDQNAVDGLRQAVNRIEQAPKKLSIGAAGGRACR